MKCQNCGKSEVSFHYSSNINGTVTETYLCSECAASRGYDIGAFFGATKMIDGFMPVFGRLDGLLPISHPGFSGGMQTPFFVRPRLDVGAPEAKCTCGCEHKAPDMQDATVDEEMNKRREINVLKERMRLAAEKDDFEKAIELREQIKGLEL